MYRQKRRISPTRRARWSYRSNSALQIADKGRNLGNHVVNILEHRTLCRAQLARELNVLDNLLIPVLDLIKELA